MEGCTVELVEVQDQAYTFGIHFQVGRILREEVMKVMMVDLRIFLCTRHSVVRFVYCL